MARSRPLLVSCQWCMSILRLIAGLYVIWYWAKQIGYLRWYLQGDSDSEEFRGLYRSGIIQLGGWLVFWAALVLNDLFVAIIDLIRTNTYLGCVMTQTMANFCFAVLIIVHNVPTRGQFASNNTFPKFTSTSDPSQILTLLVASMIVAGICSFCLFFLSLWPIVGLRSHLRMRQRWMANTKDGMMGATAHPIGPSILGHSRGIVLNPIPRIVKLLFFRRVRPVETRVYALIRNLFAVFSIGILIFRTVTALQQAQNEIRTRVVSDSCVHATTLHRLSILSDRMTFNSRQNVTPTDGVDIAIKVIWNDPYRPDEPVDSTNCTVTWSRTIEGMTQNRTLELFTCSGLQYPVRQELYMFSNGPEPTFTYQIEAQRAGIDPGGRILDIQMPRIWFVNEQDRLPVGRPFWSNAINVREHVPALKLLLGSHIMSETTLITRRFISSSIMKDIILNYKPTYRLLSLYPLVQPSTTALNSSGPNVATVTIRPTTNPGLRFHQQEFSLQDPEDSPDSCDFIDDYRSSSITDVIGSVGGLFALLQALHLLLFGRPLLWGLTGTNIINPFGLLGQCGSRGFKRRLREEYHTSSGEDGTDTIRIVKFLRDFVIEFGPADLDPEHQLRAPPQKLEAREEGTIDSQTSLLRRVRLDEVLVTKGEYEDNESQDRTNSGRTYHEV